MEEGLPPISGDFVKLYNTVVDFKQNLAKIFLDKGLVTESTKLDAIKTVAMETHADVTSQVHQLSSDVLLVFKLIAELIHATLVNKVKATPAVATSDKASQTDPITDNLVIQTAPSALIKEEKDEDYDKDEDNNDSLNIPNNTSEDVTPKSTHPPLRKSSRTSVLNRKPFVKPKKQKPEKQKVVALKPKKQKPATKLVGAQKRKQGGVVKILSTGSNKKKTLAVIASTETEGKRPRRGDRPLSTRRAAVFATNLYERTAEGRFRCKECGKEAKLQTNIRKHLRKHTGEKPYKCSQCPAVFAYPRSLKRHELVHEGIRPYKCPQCEKCFFDPTSLRTHSRVHTDDRPYVCQICGNRFRQNEGLKGHMRRHTGDRPYVCERCGMAFAAKRSLTRHIRVHTGERPYPCDQCVAAFADWTTLHNHKLVHRDSSTVDNAGDNPADKDADGKDTSGSENKPYQCQFCGIRYRQPLSLKRHLRLHSSTDSPKKASPKKPRKRKQQDGGEEVGEGEEPSSALHLQYRPYQCELCGEKFKHLRGYETHKGKHESGTLTAKKAPAKRARQDQIQHLSRQDIEQAATILASVAVNSTSMTHSSSSNMTAVMQEALPISSSSGGSTVTVLDPSTLNSIALADVSAAHLSVTNAPTAVSSAADVIQYSSESVTQMIRYPDGTLSQVTALIPQSHPHPPPAPTIMQPVSLLDNVVRVVFETNSGNVVVDSNP